MLRGQKVVEILSFDFDEVIWTGSDKTDWNTIPKRDLSCRRLAIKRQLSQWILLFHANSLGLCPKIDVSDIIIPVTVDNMSVRFWLTLMRNL